MPRAGLATDVANLGNFQPWPTPYLQGEEQCGVSTPQSVAGTIARETSLQGNMAISTMSSCSGG